MRGAQNFVARAAASSAASSRTSVAKGRPSAQCAVQLVDRFPSGFVQSTSVPAGTKSKMRKLLHLDTRSSDDRPPFFDLSLLKCRERLRRLLVTGKNLLRKVSQPRSHHRVGQGGCDCGI